MTLSVLLKEILFLLIPSKIAKIGTEKKNLKYYFLKSHISFNKETNLITRTRICIHMSEWLLGLFLFVTLLTFVLSKVEPKKVPFRIHFSLFFHLSIWGDDIGQSRFFFSFALVFLSSLGRTLSQVYFLNKRFLKNEQIDDCRLIRTRPEISDTKHLCYWAEPLTQKILLQSYSDIT